MESNGQAKINAQLLSNLLVEIPLVGKKIYIPGAGTGQMFDFLPPNTFDNYILSFSDINQNFLTTLKKRIPKGTSYQYFINDIEESKPIEPSDNIIIILVLEHIDWKKGLENILTSLPNNLYIIIQVQATSSQTIITQNTPLKPSIQKFSELAKPEAVDQESLVDFLRQKDFSLKYSKEAEVPGNKKCWAWYLQNNYKLISNILCTSKTAKL